ncbi:MAG: glycosyltransferase family 2 protein [Candidatus Omnitrophica bacterium]|nr:glycosyltransferase family 2 protein [Candidatus Omnitrophota bacterium]
MPRPSVDAVDPAATKFRTDFADKVAGTPYLSIIVPFHNEEDVIEEFYSRLVEEAECLPCAFEILFVDDGSEDATFRKMEELKRKDPHLKLVKLRWNFGQTAAIAAGCERAKGEIVITMDGDLQHDPKYLPEFLARMEEGWDLVSGYRTDRKGDPFWKRRFPSWIANRLMARISGMRLRDFGTTYKAYRRDVIQHLPLYGDFHRFIPVLSGSFKMSVCEIPIKQGLRPKGKSKYGLERVPTVFFDLIRIQFLNRHLAQPLRFFGGLGLGFFLSGSGLAAFLLYERFFRGVYMIRDQGELFFLSVFLIFVGTQLGCLGLLAELNVRLAYQGNRHKNYIVEKWIS